MAASTVMVQIVIAEVRVSKNVMVHVPKHDTMMLS